MKEKILKNLTTKVLGQNLIYYEKLDSTQKEIYRLSEEKLKDGTVIIANNQTDGIGTHGRNWYSEEGKNISFSFILYPNCIINCLDGFTIKIARCIKDVINKICNISLEIKEPNDLIYQGKKVGGILTQSTINKEIVKQIVVGIGINVNETSFPKEIEDTATSLKNITDREFSKEKIIVEFLNSFEKIFDQSV